MSIPVLTQVYDEVRRLSIAGSVVSSGDFRLKKLVPPLEQAGQKAPVFAKVAQAVTALVESTEKTSAEALLDLSTLINAILYTQGETSLDGQVDAIQTTDLGQQQTQASARVLKPLLEALSTTGSGRMEIIKDAHERGAFRDLRLVKPAMAALDDPYPEVGDFVAKNVLPLYGKAILPELRAKFDQKGRAGHVRRLALMHQLDPDGTRETVKQALDEGSKEVKVVAIECLGGSPEDLSFLLEQAKAKAKDVREAALKALAKSDAGDAITALHSALTSGDMEIAVVPIQSSRNPEVLKFVLEVGEQLKAALLGGKEKDKKEVGKQVSRFLLVLECLRGRGDKSSEKFLLNCFADRDALAAVKGEPSGKDIHQRLVSVLAGGSDNMRHALVEAHASLDAEELGQAFIAACGLRKAADVFAIFSPYLSAKVHEKKRKNDPAFAKRDAITEVLALRWRRYDPLNSDDGDSQSDMFDPRWLDLAVSQCRQAGTLTLARPGQPLGHLELVLALARPGHAESNQLLTQAFDDRIKKSKDFWDFGQVLETMIRVRHPAATDATIATIEKHAKNYSLYWVGRLIPQLPKDALPKLEALLPTLPEKVIDQLLDYMSQLKNKP
jgi:hypothetical protein